MAGSLFVLIQEKYFWEDYEKSKSEPSAASSLSGLGNDAQKQLG
jgi:hypothetical protein